MDQMSRSALLILVYVSGLSLVQVNSAYTCEAPNEIGCASCGKLALCDASLKPTELSCGSGKVCDNTTEPAGCYLYSKAGSPTLCNCDKSPGYSVDPFDPNKYLMCVSTSSRYFLSCAAGLIFDESVNKCVVPPPEPPTLPPPSCSKAGFFGQGCEAWYACYPNPDDETKLIATEIMNCDGGKIFDANILDCDTEANVISLYEPFKCDVATPLAQMDSVECNAFRICMQIGEPVGEKVCCEDGQRFDSNSMTCVPEGQVPDENCPQVNECVASKLSFNCSSGLASTTSTTISTTSAVSSSSSSLSSTSSSFSSSTSISLSSSTTFPSSSSSTTSSSSSSSTSPSSTTTISSTSTTGTVPTCATDGAFPYPGDCSKYYWCSGGKYQVQSCPSQMFFDKVKRYCNVASSVVC